MVLVMRHRDQRLRLPAPQHRAEAARRAPHDPAVAGEAPLWHGIPPEQQPARRHLLEDGPPTEGDHARVVPAREPGVYVGRREPELADPLPEEGEGQLGEVRVVLDPAVALLLVVPEQARAMPGGTLDPRGARGVAGGADPCEVGGLAPTQLVAERSEPLPGVGRANVAHAPKAVPRAVERMGHAPRRLSQRRAAWTDGSVNPGDDRTSTSGSRIIAARRLPQGKMGTARELGRADAMQCTRSGTTGFQRDLFRRSRQRMRCEGLHRDPSVAYDERIGTEEHPGRGLPHEITELADDLEFADLERFQEAGRQSLDERGEESPYLAETAERTIGNDEDRFLGVVPHDVVDTALRERLKMTSQRCFGLTLIRRHVLSPKYQAGTAGRIAPRRFIAW